MSTELTDVLRPLGPQQISATQLTSLIVAEWVDAAPETVTLAEGEMLNRVLVKLLRKIESAGVAMPYVSVSDGGGWVDFGQRPPSPPITGSPESD